MAANRISTEIRAIEHEFDNAHLTNPLHGVDRPTAIWTLLSVFEDAMAKPVLRGDPPDQQRRALRQNLLINALRHPLAWLQTCSPGRLRVGYQDDLYGHADDLLQLGRKYDAVETVFIFASRGRANLTLEGRKVIPVPLVEAADARYYAYNRFITADDDIPPPSQEFRETLASIADRVVVTAEGFRLRIDPNLVKEWMAGVAPSLAPRFHLPDEWRTTRYSLGDFRRIYQVLTSLASIQYQGRLIAVARGAPALGFADAVLRFGRDELHSRVRRYSGLDELTVGAVLEDLTYGARGISRPDPIVQPLIHLNGDVLIAPSLILCSSPQRNHCVLLNAIPEEKSVYSRLVDQKESLMCDEILSVCGGRPYRSFSGSVAGRKDLPNIDLALIEEDSKELVILELKWFIAPDEVREIFNKEEELLKGIRQARALKAAFSDGTGALQKTLHVLSDYTCSSFVVSHNWIGGLSLQHDDVPIISLRHLKAALKKASSLGEVTRWLSERRYLPSEGIHFIVKSSEISIGVNSTEWWDIQPLISDAYDAVATVR